MKEVIGLTDFSEPSINALEYAASLAASIKAKLFLYHILAEKTDSIYESDKEWECYRIEKVIHKLKDIAQRLLRSNIGLEVETDVQFGPVEQVMAEVGKKVKPLAIVMSPTEKDRFELFVDGSCSLAISHEAHVPVMMVPDNVTYHKIKKITVAIDLKHVSNTFFPQSLIDWLQQFHSVPEIVYVNESGKCEDTNNADSIIMQFSLAGFHPDVHFIKNIDVKSGIQNYIEENAPDLLVLFPRQRAFFQKSVSKAFILHPQIPTLIIPDCM